MNDLKKVGDIVAVHSKQVTESPIGIGFEKLDRALFDPEKAYEKVAELGVKWVRIQSGWQRTEQQQGVYDFGWLDEIVDNLLKRGLRPWICLCYGNQLYTAKAAEVFGAVACPPIHSDEEKQAWHNYIAAVTSHYRGKVSWFEIWNEPDGVGWRNEPDGPNGTDYGHFAIDTAKAIKEGNPEAHVIGCSVCKRGLKWLNDVFKTGAGRWMDAISYHAYCEDEVTTFDRIRALKGMCRSYNLDVQLIQGETGAQSRNDGYGALKFMAWTEARQAKYIARHMIADLMEDVLFASYFSTVDMAEALKGKVADKGSRLDYGYFGVMGADFNEDGIATGEYTPKPSYRTLQTMAAIFREDFSKAELPIDFVHGNRSERLRRPDDEGKTLVHCGFRKANGSAALAYWKSTELLTTSYESFISVEAAALPEPLRLIDLIDGQVYELDPDKVIRDKTGYVRCMHIPLRDYPLLLCFGDFADIEG